ncbi:MAG: YicC family protein [Clostridia bacterium]|nr:YicC family protein [Clostridia bacterium]
MIKSMTGYGRSRMTVNGYDVSFEIRSVNNRYLDVNVRLPRVYGYLEEKIKKAVQERVSRGKADVYLSVERPAGEAAEIRMDAALANQYLEAMRAYAREAGLRDDISVTSLSRFPDVFTQKAKEEDEDLVWESVRAAVEAGLDQFVAMRQREGEALFRDLDARLDTMAELLEKIRAYSGDALRQHREKLEEKLREYLADREIDEGRLLTEVGLIADRIDTGEEMTRLASHIDQFRGLIRQDAPGGRTMDFLVQEMNREVNTIGSKCAMLEITQLVIDAKNEIERIREQIQNIE